MSLQHSLAIALSTDGSCCDESPANDPQPCLSSCCYRQDRGFLSLQSGSCCWCCSLLRTATVTRSRPGVRQILCRYHFIRRIAVTFSRICVHCGSMMVRVAFLLLLAFARYMFTEYARVRPYNARNTCRTARVHCRWVAQICPLFNRFVSLAFSVDCS